RFRLAGLGLSGVAVSRSSWAWEPGDPDAEAKRLEWRATPSDEFDDCPACVIGTQVEFLREQGRYAEALELGSTQQFSCNVEPTKTHHSMALAALLVGDGELALRHHRLALASYEGKNREIAPSRGLSFELMARGGRVDRALRALRNEDLSLLDHASSPLARLGFLLGVLSGLSANLDRGADPTGLTGNGRETISGLHAWVLGEAKDLAESFDRRNGNDHYAARVEAAEHAVRAAQQLDFGVAADAAPGPEDQTASIAGAGMGTTISTGVAHGGGLAASTDPSNIGLFSGADLAGVGSAMLTGPRASRERAEGLAGQRQYAAASLEYEVAATGFEAEGLLEASGLCYAEAAQCAALADDEDRAQAMFGLALSRLQAGGAPEGVLAEVLTAWAPLAVRMSETDQILGALSALLARLEIPVETDELSEDLAERRRTEHTRMLADVRDTLARCLASTPASRLPAELDGSSAAAEATLAAEEYASIGRLADAAHAFWLAGRVQRNEGDSPAAVYSLESAFEGFGLAQDREHRAEAAGELIELLRASGLPQRADEITAQL
ncbi:MAG: hypothetical protein J0H64_04730, partial [Actinobacteria bacterium]|nr:hypothetical protein [Actinomycetota bacterium]